jgi:hypothetical protein
MMARLTNVIAEGAAARFVFSDPDRSFLHVPPSTGRHPAAFTSEDVASIAGTMAGQFGFTLDGIDHVVAPRPVPKLAIVDRMTDEELDAALAFFDANPRVRERWSAATEINPANPTTIAMLEALYGVERTAELLVPE